MIRDFDIVLPLRFDIAGRESDLQRAELGLFPSLLRSKYDSLVRIVTVVSPREDLAIIEDRISEKFPQFRYSFISDEDTAVTIGYAEESFKAVPNWFKQQLLKLATVEKSENEVVLVLDADVIVTTDITATLASSNALPYHAMGLAKFRDWFTTSADALHINFDTLNPTLLQYAMGVTPEFLWSKNVAEMINHIRKLAGNVGWGPYLMTYFKTYTLTWTEYSLYWIWYAHKGSELRAHYRANLYEFLESPERIRDDILKSPNCPFAVLQSTKLTIAQCSPLYDALNKTGSDIAQRGEL